MPTQNNSYVTGREKLSETDRHRILVEWNDTYVEYPRDVCLNQLFESQVELTPEAVAVEFEGLRLTYRELNQRSNQLAHYLQTFGVGPEVLVGVFMERSLELVIGLYGILKAGGAYVPLDPEYPKERVSFMIKDTQVPVLLTQKRLKSGLPHNDANIIDLEDDWPVIGKRRSVNLSSGVTADNLAYVIYTSGSTGKPKGVMNCHSGICNRLLWMQDEYQLTKIDSVLQKTPYSFDVSVWELFWPLLFGAKLVMAKPGGHRDSSYLVRTIVEHKITTLHFVPSMMQIFLDDRAVGNCHSLKRVICSGEALPYDLQERFFANLDSQLHNLYGPTEAAVDVTYWKCDPQSNLNFVPIGYPVANTQIYVLNEQMQPVPIGDSGELHIGGIQVARGYLNRPELTAERFIADPFSNIPGDRLYKTGDLACHLPNGAVKYLGRIDHQVKIRGVRIELGEIESVLETHPHVKQAVVVDKEKTPGEKSLIAYLLASPDQRISTSKLRNYLEDRLPESMIPSFYLTLDSMPLSPNGKVDRRALPEPDNKRPELDQEYVRPGIRIERYIADIWREILDIDKIGVHDRFFELGGNSIKAAQFINKLQQDLGENIYIVSIFEAPSIAEYTTFLQKDYSEALMAKFGYAKDTPRTPQAGKTCPEVEEKIDVDTIEQMRACIPSLPPDNVGEEDIKNPPAIFILAPPRSGTTLLRVMLAGHPDLFAASELQLLGFNTLEERRIAYSGKFSLWLEGTIRTTMELRGCDPDEAYRIMDDCEKQNFTTKQFYKLLQDWIGKKILVDKSPSYVFDPAALQKAERDFDKPLYIHLVRHPFAMVRSFERYHMDQVLFLNHQPFHPRRLAELIWLISHQNATRFLKEIPQERQFSVHFEDLVNHPQTVMESLCRTLRLPFHSDLTKPYKDIDKKMVDGIYEDSKPMGDTRILDHHDVNPKVAQNWKGVLTNNFLSEITWQLANTLGYKTPEQVGDADEHRAHTADIRRKRLAQSRVRRKQHRS